MPLQILDRAIYRVKQPVFWYWQTFHFRSEFIISCRGKKLFASLSKLEQARETVNKTVNKKKKPATKFRNRLVFK